MSAARTTRTCVDGSPTDCAAKTPTGSPGSTILLMDFIHIKMLNATVDSNVLLPSGLACRNGNKHQRRHQ